ncbi:unnamed protein product [Prunus brigantina]
MSESETEQSSPEPLSPRTAAVRAGLRRNYSSSSTESRSCESESSSKMAEIPNNNNNVDGGAALVVQPRKPLCEFSIPKVTDQPSCIVYPQLTVDRFELKSGMIHLLPTYYGNTTEDPYMHIKQFFEICATIKIQGLDDEQIKMRLFPFSLKDKAKMMVDATSGEGLMNKTADEAFTLFESLSANSQQWSHSKGRGAPMKAVVSEIASSLSNRASGTFPSQTEVNPRHYEQVKAVHILRSGKQVDNKVGDENEEQEDGKNVETIQPPQGQPTASNKQPLNASERAQALRYHLMLIKFQFQLMLLGLLHPFPAGYQIQRKIKAWMR